MSHDMDNLDRGILHLLQVDARHTTAQEIADRTGVSASTVRNRIDKLEEEGVITGYHPQIDYEAANLPFQAVFTISASPTRRGEAVEDLLNIKGVVGVYEMLTGRRNLIAEVVATSSPELSRITEAIHDLGVEIESSAILKQRRVQPFDQFHYDGELFDEGDAG